MVADNTSKFKVGDRVRTKGYEGTHWDGEGTIVSIGGYCNIVEIDGDRGGFHDHELARVAAGETPKSIFDEPQQGEPRQPQQPAVKPKFKVGDRVRVLDDSHGHAEPGTLGTVSKVEEDYHTIVLDAPFDGHGVSGREWNFFYPDEELEYVASPASNDNSTTGFTVPLCAYDDDTVDLTALGRAYLSDWRDAKQALAA